MNQNEWSDRFRSVFSEGVKRYRAGQRQVAAFFNEEETAFLAGIGCTAQELFDFVEDYSNGGDPSFETVLLVTAVRREYLFSEQLGVTSTVQRSMDDFPAKTAEVGGIAWLPRIIAKARAKLRGELPAEMMYGCGGDRPFARRNKFHLADFLRVVWRAGDDDQPIIEFVKSSGAS